MTFIEQCSLEFVYLVCQVSSSEPVSEVWQILHSLLATLVKWEIYVNKFKFKSLPLILLFLSASCVRWGCKINENYLAASCPLIRGNIIHTLFGDMGHLSRRRNSFLFSRHDLSSVNETFVIKDHSLVFHLLWKISCIMNFQYIICSLFFPEQDRMSISLFDTISESALLQNIFI